MSSALRGAAEQVAKSAAEWLGREGTRASREAGKLETAVVETVERAAQRGEAMLETLQETVIHKADELTLGATNPKKGIPAISPQVLTPVVANLPTRLRLAKDPGTPPEVLAELAGDIDDGVRWVVAENVNTPLEALHRLAADADRYVRTAAAYNPTRRRHVPVREDWLAPGK